MALKSYITINNCKHYFLNEDCSPLMYNIHSGYYVEEDYDTKHPFGTVYRPKGIIDTVIRFVRQPDNSTFMFSILEWNKKDNIYLQEKTKLKQFIKDYL